MSEEQIFLVAEPTESRLDLTLGCDKWGNLLKEAIKRIDLKMTETKLSVLPAS